MQQLLMAVSNRKRSEFAKADTKKNKNVLHEADTIVKDD